MTVLKRFHLEGTYWIMNKNILNRVLTFKVYIIHRVV